MLGSTCFDRSGSERFSSAFAKLANAAMALVKRENDLMLGSSQVTQSCERSMLEGALELKVVETRELRMHADAYGVQKVVDRALGAQASSHSAVDPRNIHQDTMRLLSRAVPRPRLPQRSCTSLGRRTLTNNGFFRVSEEVREALHSKKPVVALETTIYTHGANGKIRRFACNSC